MGKHVTRHTSHITHHTSHSFQVIIHDRQSQLAQLREALFRLSTVILGANTHAQDALAALFDRTPPQFFSGTLAKLEQVMGDV